MCVYKNIICTILEQLFSSFFFGCYCIYQFILRVRTARAYWSFETSDSWTVGVSGNDATQNIATGPHIITHLLTYMDIIYTSPCHTSYCCWSSSCLPVARIDSVSLHVCTAYTAYSLEQKPNFQWIHGISGSSHGRSHFIPNGIWNGLEYLDTLQFSNMDRFHRRKLECFQGWAGRKQGSGAGVAVSKNSQVAQRILRFAP